MKKTIAIILSLLLLSSMGLYKSKDAGAASVDHNCEPYPSIIVPTNFTGLATSQVTPGKSFSITNITSSADRSSLPPVTITSSELKLSATNTTSSSYTETNTSSYPDPDSGDDRAVFPDWSLTANGAIGSKIVIKIVSASAEVEGLGTSTCSPNKTLLTIDIVASAASPGNQNNGGESSTKKKANDTSTDDKSKDNQDDQEDTQREITTEATSEASERLTSSVSILVKNDAYEDIQGAYVQFDEGQSAISQEDGTAVLDGVTLGEHSVEVSYGSFVVSQSVFITSDSSDNIKTIIIPSKSDLVYRVSFVSVGAVFLLSSAYYIIRFR